MKRPRHSALRLAGWTTAGLLAVATAAGVGIAVAGSPTDVTAASTVSTASAPPAAGDQNGARRRDDAADHRGRHGGWAGLAARRALHGELVVKGEDGKPTTVLVQRGEVTAVSSTSVTIRSEDGYTASYRITAETRVRVNGDRGAISGVKAGNKAWVVARTSGGGTAATVLVTHT